MVVSICAPCPVSTRRPTPRVDRSRMMLTRWTSVRLRRASFQRLGAVYFRDAGVADQHVSQTAVCDIRAKAPSGARRRVSYPVSDSMSCRRRANEHGSETRADTPALITSPRRLQDSPYGAKKIGG